MKNHFLILFVLFVLGCTKKATIKLPKAESKLVVTCFITPEDSVISAVVRFSTPKFGPKDSSSVNDDDIQDAVVKLSDGNSSIILPFDQNAFFYRIPSSAYPVVPGKKYFLTVSLPNGLMASGETIVPEDKLFFETLNLPIRNQDSVMIEHDVNITAADIPQKPTYLALFMHNTIISKNQNNNFPFFSFLNSWGYFDTDEKTPKSKLTVNTVNYLYSFDTILHARVDIALLNCSKEFYLYNKSVQEGGAGGNPFSDPVMIYTNITNGFGCFGSYRQETTSRILR